MRRILVIPGLLWLLLHPLATTADAQDGFASACESNLIVDPQARDACYAAAQAVTSAQPVLGLLIAGGNPTIGSAGDGGLRLGFIPRVSAGLRLNIVPIRLPDLVAEQLSGTAGGFIGRYGAPLPALGGDISLRVFDGVSIAPSIGGIGGISLLGSASYLPFQLFAEEFELSSIPYGVGARLHLINESFTLPGVSLSVMRRSMPTVRFGDVCRGAAVPVDDGAPGEPEAALCSAAGDRGEFAADLTSWNARAVVSKRFLGVGATLGLGRDSHGSDVQIGFRGDDIAGATPIFRVRDPDLESARWTVFGSLGMSLIVANLTLEGGWQQGGSPIAGFRDLDTNFDPRGGVWYGSLGARLAL